MHGYGTPLRFKKDILSICAIDVEELGTTTAI
jgi:hypothetical protein